MTRALIVTALFVTGWGVAGAGQPDKQPDKKADKIPSPGESPVADPKSIPSAIEGGYTVASGERDGKPIPQEAFKDAIVRVTGGRIVGTDRDRNEFLVATYDRDRIAAALATAKPPWSIDMKLLAPNEVLVSGLIKKEGHVLTLVFALPGGEAPKEFKTKEKQVMLVLRGFVLDPPPPLKFPVGP